MTDDIVYPYWFQRVKDIQAKIDTERDRIRAGRGKVKNDPPATGSHCISIVKPHTKFSSILKT